jgi:phospholipid transport system substrate-binding protein
MTFPGSPPAPCRIGALLALAAPAAARPARPRATRAGHRKPPPPTGAAKPAPPAAAEAAPAGSDSPLADLKKANQQLKKSFGNQEAVVVTRGRGQEQRDQKIVGSFLDFEELARRALAKHWDGLTCQAAADFVKTLRELVERNYIKQLYGQPDYDLRLEREEKTANEATVFGTCTPPPRARRSPWRWNTSWCARANRWVVYDVITDDLSLLENYRAEFNKVIAKESFDALLARMKKKLAEK